MATFLWYSVGTVLILLQNIIQVYPYLNTNYIQQSISEKTCNILGLFQCICLDPVTKHLFIKANLTIYLYPLINTPLRQKPFEHIRVTSLGIIGALVKNQDHEIIKYLINTELIVLCLRIIKRGYELPRIVATFILQKILLDNHGLVYICQTDERLYAVIDILIEIFSEVVEKQSEDD